MISMVQPDTQAAAAARDGAAAGAGPQRPPVAFFVCGLGKVMQGKEQSWGGSWAGFPFAFHSQARGVWLMSAADKGDKRIIKRPQSPFIFLLFFPLISFIVAVLSVYLFAPFRGVGCTRALAEVVVCAVGRVVTLPAVEITAQATALLVLVMISCR